MKDSIEKRRLLTAESRATLRAAREAAGLSQESLAVRLGVGRVCLTRFERGEINPSWPVLRRWAAVLGFEALDRGLELRRKRNGK